MWVWGGKFGIGWCVGVWVWSMTGARIGSGVLTQGQMHFRKHKRKPAGTSAKMAGFVDVWESNSGTLGSLPLQGEIVGISRSSPTLRSWSSRWSHVV